MTPWEVVGWVGIIVVALPLTVWLMKATDERKKDDPR